MASESNSIGLEGRRESPIPGTGARAAHEWSPDLWDSKTNIFDIAFAGFNRHNCADEDCD